MYLESVKGVNILIYGYSRASSRCGGGLLPASDFLSQEDIVELNLGLYESLKRTIRQISYHSHEEKGNGYSTRMEDIEKSLWRVGYGDYLADTMVTN